MRQVGTLRLGASATLATSKHRLIRLWSVLPHSMRSPIHDYLDRPADNKGPRFSHWTAWGSGRGKTYAWPSSRQRAQEAAPLSRSFSPCSIGTTGVKTTAELFEQVDAVGSAVGTTRDAVRRPILSPEIMCSELLCRARPDAGLGHLARRWTYGVRCTTR